VVTEPARGGGGSWDAYYQDGRTAARQPATVRVMRTGLEIRTGAGATLWWPYAQVRQTQGFYAGEQVRLERGDELAEAVLVSDPAFLVALRAAGQDVARHFHDPTRRRFRVQLTLLAAAGVVALTAALYVWGIPALAGAAARRVPVSWEERLGRTVADELAPPGQRCDGPAGREALDRIVRTLLAPAGPNPYTIRVVVVDRPSINAFAVPGGYTVVFRGLLERTERPEELAGVLAHELQHVLHRHATRQLLADTSTGLLISALTGDITGTLAYGLEAARTLGRLRYSRAAEEEADADGMRMLGAAGVDPAGMIAFYELLRKEAPQLPASLEYLSTHPTTESRLARLRALAGAAPPGGTRPLLSEPEWADLRAICDRRPPV
jgi:Zn-dependent protease with chaperone function